MPPVQLICTWCQNIALNLSTWTHSNCSNLISLSWRNNQKWRTILLFVTYHAYRYRRMISTTHRTSKTKPTRVIHGEVGIFGAWAVKNQYEKNPKRNGVIHISGVFLRVQTTCSLSRSLRDIRKKGKKNKVLANKKGQPCAHVRQNNKPSHEFENTEGLSNDSCPLLISNTKKSEGLLFGSLIIANV